jgi:fused signal recognition particle receptor
MQSEVIDYLANAGNHENTWFLFGGPIFVFAAVAIALVVIIRLRRKREERELNTEYSAAGKDALSSKEAEASATRGDLTAEASAPVPAGDLADLKNDSQSRWLERLRSGLAKTREAVAGGLGGIFAGGAKIDADTLERIHEILYRADVGVKTADRLVAGLKSRFSGQTVEWDVLQRALVEIGEEIFTGSERPLAQPASGLFVLLVVGVNGVGKTTTIGKLAAHYVAAGKKVMLCAADTFRAAAIEQLQVWGERNQVPVIKQHQGADPAAVAFDGVQAAMARGAEVLIIDTAGRLHNKNDLMHELAKIRKSIAKACPDAPHETWIVVDATTGQNATQQVKAFSEVTPLTGIVVTKLDGTAKGGVIVGIADQFKIPIRYIGVGEKAVDLKSFDGGDFMRGLMGV